MVLNREYIQQQVLEQNSNSGSSLGYASLRRYVLIRRESIQPPIAAIVVLVHVCVLLLKPTIVFSNEFRYAEDARPTTLNPIYAKEMAEIRLIELLFSGLFKDSIFLEPEGDMARSWRLSNDKKSLEVTLDERYWHDGKKVTSEDVVYTIDVVKRAKERSQEFFRVALISRVEVLSAKKLVIHFGRVLAEPLRALYFKIVPKHIWQQHQTEQASTENIYSKLIGCGPFAYVKHSDTSVQLRRVADDSEARGISSIKVLFETPAHVQADLLSLGYLDAVVWVLPSKIETLQTSDSIRLFRSEAASVWYLGVNHADRHLSRRLVREALIYSIDREKIRKESFGLGTTLSGPFADSSRFYNSQISPREASKRKVARLMMRAGYHKDKRVYKDRDNREVRFQMVLNVQWYTVLRQPASAIVDSLNAHGFVTDLIWLDPKSWYQRVEKAREFDLTIGIWTFNGRPGVRFLFHSRGRQNFINYRSARMDALLEQMEAAKDIRLLIDFNKRIHRVVYEELPYIFLWTVPKYNGITTKLYDVDIHPFAFFTSAAEWKYR